MAALRQRMLDAMVQRGFALRTREAYVEAVTPMAKYFRCQASPAAWHRIASCGTLAFQSRNRTASTTSDRARDV